MRLEKEYSVIRIPKSFYNQMITDLMRPHAFAAERVGFFSTNSITAGKNFKIITITGYHPVEDSDYINDKTVGAKINSNVIRKAMQRIISTGKGCLHVHVHDHSGKPGPSYTDLKSLPELSKAFHNADPNTASGYIIFSRDSFYSQVSIGEEFKQFEIDQMAIVGYPLKFAFTLTEGLGLKKSIYNRQSFLGENSYELLSSVRVGIVGLGGGGSHIVQQLAHLGLIHYSIFDGDHIEETNHNRLIGGWFTDIARKLKKTLIARRLIKKINPKVQVKIFNGTWQEYSRELQKCDIVVGCVDSFDQRAQLEAVSRRSLIPCIDIGMDVHKIKNIGYSISGQVILSMPGMPCMKCMQFITENKLEEEAKKYGASGSNPQVVWSNGILASTAIGVVVDLITGWTKAENKKVYLSYDGDLGYLNEHPRIEHCPVNCNHFTLENTGDVIFRPI